MINYKGQKSVKLLKLLLALILVFTQLITITTFGAAASSTPFSLAASQYTDTQVKLEWNSIPDAQYYQIYKDSISTPQKVININSDINYLSYTDTGLKPETQYTYKVRALDSNMNELASATTSVKTSGIVKPTILSALFDVNRRDITIKWTHNSPIAAGSIIKKVTGSGTTIKATINDTNTSCTFNDSITDSSDQLKYVIVSKDVDGHISPDSDTVTVYPIVPPAITASMENGISTISWSDNRFIENFALEISRYDGSNWGLWTDTNRQIASGTRIITHTPDIAGSYRYRLNAKNSIQYSGYSNISGAVSKPAAPTNLSCTFSETNKIDLSWINDPNNVSDLKVERKIDSGSYTVIAALDKSKPSCTDTYDFKPNSTYYYRVVAYNSDSDRTASVELAISAKVPLVPSSLCLGIISGSQIELNWTDTSDNEKGFIIERKVDSGNFSEFSKVPAGTTRFLDSTVISKSTYTYRVSSYNPIGSSNGYSNAVSANTTKIPSINYFSVTPASSSQVNLSWTYSGDAKFNTVIERKNGADGAWATVANLDTGVLSYTDKLLMANAQYFYRVKAVLDYNVYLQACPSDPKGSEVYTKMITPANFSGSAPTYTQVDLTWSDCDGETGYVIERKQVNGNYLVIATTPADTKSYSDKGVVSNTSYLYRIKSISTNNSSDYSELSLVSSPFSKPGEFKANAVSETQAVLTWKDNSSTETSYEIWRASSTSALSVLYKTLEKNTTSYTDSGLLPDTQYLYKVRTCISANNTFSEFTNEIGVRTITLASPDQLQFTIVSDTENDLS